MKSVFKLGYGRLLQSRNLVTDAKDKGTGWLAHRKWDAVIVGGGHNGLTAAAYLARAGLDVAVLERRHVLGGAAVTEEIVPGFKFSRGSYLQSLLRPSIIKELELDKHGMKLLPRNPSSFTPGVDGQYLLMGPDADLNVSEISKFSKRDAAAYPRYEQQLEQFSSFITPLLDIIPPEISKEGSFSGKISDRLSRVEVLGGILKRATSMTQADIMAFMELMLAPASKVLNNWFESDLLKATLATDAIIGTMGSVDTPGSGYVLLHHVMGETNGARGIWSYVEGGMGAVSMAIAKAAKTAGATLVTNAEVDHFAVEKQDNGLSAVTGVVLADGTVIEAKRVLSNATAAATFLKMVPSNVLPEDFVKEITSIDYQSGTTKLNLAVNDLPRFQACSQTEHKPGPEHRGTIHLGADSMGDLLAAHKDACNGYPSTRPIIEMTIPSALDNTISPPGKHVINMFVQYTPYHLKKGNWSDSSTREGFAKRCFKLVDEYAPGFSASVIDYEMLAPPDLERVFGLTGGNIFHGAMGLDSLFLLRPVKGWSGYKTPLRGLFLCGSGAHPGGGVMGAPGRNAARVVLQEVGKSLR